MTAEAPTAGKKAFKIPHTYVILCTIILLAAIGTYVLPPGVYDRARDERTGRTLVDPQSYHAVERAPTSPFQLFSSVPEGMVAAADIIFFIFICGGVFTGLQDTGAIDAGLSKAILALRGKEKLLIPVTMFLFSLLGATMGMSEEAIVFIPIGVALARAVGYDDIVAVSMISTGAAIGFASGVANPFTVGVAQSISELPLFSGIGFRMIGFVALYIAGVGYTMRYANMVKLDPTKSYLHGLATEGEHNIKSLDNVTFTKTHGLVLLVIVAFLAYMLYGVMQLGYYIMELATIFLAMGVIGGLVGRLRENGGAGRNAAETDGAGHTVFEKGGLRADMTAYKVFIDGVQADMAPKEYDLLFFLIRKCSGFPFTPVSAESRPRLPARPGHPNTPQCPGAPRRFAPLRATRRPIPINSIFSFLHHLNTLFSYLSIA